MLNSSSSLSSSYTSSSAAAASSSSSSSIHCLTSTASLLKGAEPREQAQSPPSGFYARSDSHSPNINGSHYNLPPIPVMMRHPYIVASVKQYRCDDQSDQLQQHIVSESFIPMAPNLIKPPRKRRRPPFSYSSLIAQAILESEHERMTLRDIYTWITARYPALYNAEDTGWQNTIRHNLSLNRCFKKIPKSDTNGQHRGKGGYWTIDPTYMEKFKNGSFVKGSSSSLRRKTSGGMSTATASATTASYSPSSPPRSLPDTPVSTMTPNPSTASSSNGHPYYKHQFLSSINQPCNPSHPIYHHSSNATSNSSRLSSYPITTTTAYPHANNTAQQSSEQPRPVMQIHNLLN